MDADLFAVLDRAATVAAKRCKRVTRLPLEDLRQAAWVEIMQAMPAWEAADGDGDPFPYMYGVAMYSLPVYMRRATHPVHGDAQDAQAAFLSSWAVPLDNDPVGEGWHAMHPALACVATPDVQYLRAEHAWRISLALERCLGDPGAVCFALGVYAHGFKPDEVARAHGVPVQRVYQTLRQIAQRIRASTELRALWQETP